MKNYIEGDVSEVLLEADARRQRQDLERQAERVGTKVMDIAFWSILAITYMYIVYEFINLLK